MTLHLRPLPNAHKDQLEKLYAKKRAELIAELIEEEKMKEPQASPAWWKWEDR